MTQAVKRAVRAAQGAVAEITAEIERIEEQINELHREVLALRRERERWLKLAEDRPKPPVEVAAMASAGPKAVGAVADYLRSHGRAYQFEITRDVGLNSGTITHALRVLAHDHKIVATGRKRRNSAEFEWTDEDREPVAV